MHSEEIHLNPNILYHLRSIWASLDVIFIPKNKEIRKVIIWLTRLKAMLRWAYKNDLVPDISYLDKLEPFKENRSNRERIQNKYLESDELKLLLKEMSVDLWRGVTQFLSLTGLRIGELITLEKQDIDIDARVIYITKTYDTNNQIVTSTKTLTSTRDVYIQDELLPVIHNLNLLML